MIVKYLFVATIALTIISGCDKPENKFPTKSTGKVTVLNNEAVLQGEGTLVHKGVIVRSVMSKLFVNNENYGAIPRDARTVLHVYDDGSFTIFVNGEQRHRVTNYDAKNTDMRVKRDNTETTRQNRKNQNKPVLPDLKKFNN